MSRFIGVACFLLCAVGFTQSAQPTQSTSANPPAGPPPAPYALPFQLRPAVVPRVVRIENTYGWSSLGRTNVVLGTAAYAITPSWGVLGRTGAVTNSPYGGDNTESSFLNVMLGGIYGTKFATDFRFAAYLPVFLPVASGGGDPATDPNVIANGQGLVARAGMDNAMFAADYLTVAPGLDLAWVKYGAQVQLEATLLQLMRVKGQSDTSRTNFTSGLNVSYFIVPQLSLTGELKYQRWLSTPAAVAANTATRQNLSAALAVRAHVKADKLAFRPGLSVTRGFVGPVDANNWTMVTLDAAMNY